MLLALGLACLDQQTLSAQAANFRITGHIVNAETGAPLAGASVALLPVADGAAISADDQAPRRSRRAGRGGSESSGQRPSALAAATTTDDGAFSFDHLGPGKYSLQASRRGFLTAAYQEHGFYSTAIVTGAGLVSEGLTLRLSPGAVIAGSLLDSAGDPVEQGVVNLYRLNDDGLSSIHMYRSATIDDVGAYEFAHLPPGTYFVSATGRVWYATGVLSQPGEAASSVQQKNLASLDLAYPRTFYADSTDANAATPVPIRGGEHLRIDLHLQALPAVHMSYTLPAGNGEDRDASRFPSFFQPVFGDREPASEVMTGGTESNGQRTLLISLPPGDYDAEVNGRMVPVHAAGDAILDASGGTASTSVSGKLAPVAGATLSGPVELMLQPADGRGGSSLSAVAREGSFSFEQVHAGAYELSAQSEGHTLSIVQLAASGGTLNGHVFEVGTQPIALAATLAPASAMLAGYVRKPAAATTDSSAAGDPASGAMVVLVPQYAADHSLYRRDQSDSDGSFTLRQVPAGRYTLLAIEDGWALDWARPEVIAHYLPGGQPVTIPATSTGTIHLQKPVIVQPR